MHDGHFIPWVGAWTSKKKFAPKKETPNSTLQPPLNKPEAPITIKVKKVKHDK